MCIMFVLILASSMVLGVVSMSVLLYVVCFLHLGVVILGLSVMHVVGCVSACRCWCVCCATGCSSECGVLCYL